MSGLGTTLQGHTTASAAQHPEWTNSDISEDVEIEFQERSRRYVQILILVRTVLSFR